MSEVENEDFVDAEQDTDLVKKDVTVEGAGLFLLIFFPEKNKQNKKIFFLCIGH